MWWVGVRENDLGASLADAMNVDAFHCAERADRRRPSASRPCRAACGGAEARRVRVGVAEFVTEWRVISLLMLNPRFEEPGVKGFSGSGGAADSIAAELRGRWR